MVILLAILSSSAFVERMQVLQSVHAVQAVLILGVVICQVLAGKQCKYDNIIVNNMQYY